MVQYLTQGLAAWQGVAAKTLRPRVNFPKHGVSVEKAVTAFSDDDALLLTIPIIRRTLWAQAFAPLVWSAQFCLIRRS